jgi:uncharacterized protein (DUF427 family)
MARALWNGAVLAESDDLVEVDGYVYFPLASLRREHFRPSTHQSVCSWKGIASYFDVEAGGQVNANAAWIYRDPKPEARHVTDRVAFWKGIVVEK